MAYVKPMILDSDEIAEGVFMASGSSPACYSVGAYIHQAPEEGRDDYRIQLDAHHNADHGNSKQVLTISFNQPVTYCWSGGSLIGGDGTNTLQIAYYYYQNPVDNIGLGELVVKSGEGLTITFVSVSVVDSPW